MFRKISPCWKTWGLKCILKLPCHRKHLCAILAVNFSSFLVLWIRLTQVNMERLKSFHSRRLILQPAPDSFTAEGQVSRWSNPDLDPVPKQQKRWEWYHVGGFWIAEGFSAAQIQTASASVALGLNPGIALIAYLIGNILVMMACCGTGYIGSKVTTSRRVLLSHKTCIHHGHAFQHRAYCWLTYGRFSTRLIFLSYQERKTPLKIHWR